MDWLQFISSLVSALAWPAAITIVVLQLKAPILKAIPQIRSFKYGELHIDLAEQLKAVQDTLPDAPDEPATESQPIQSSVALQLAAISPRAAILHSWIEVEGALEGLLFGLGLEFNPRNRDTRFKMQVLRDRKVIDELTHVTFLRLASVRNDAVHLTDRETTYDDAVMMATSCRWLIDKLIALTP